MPIPNIRPTNRQRRSINHKQPSPFILSPRMEGRIAARFATHYPDLHLYRKEILFPKQNEPNPVFQQHGSLFHCTEAPLSLIAVYNSPNTAHKQPQNGFFPVLQPDRYCKYR